MPVLIKIFHIDNHSNEFLYDKKWGMVANVICVFNDWKYVSVVIENFDLAW